MMQIIYNSCLPADNNDGGQGYLIDSECSPSFFSTSWLFEESRETVSSSDNFVPPRTALFPPTYF